MLAKYVERIAETQKEVNPPSVSNDIKVSDSDLFKSLGRKINVMKKPTAQ